MFPTAFEKVKAGNTSENLLNEIESNSVEVIIS